MDFTTTRNTIHINLSSTRRSNKLQEQEDLVEAAVVQATVEDTHMEAQEDGASCQEEVDAEALHTDLEVQDSPVPQAGREDHQEDQEESEEDQAAAAEGDQETLWALELDQTLASAPRHSATLLWKQSLAK